ncbi:hypothetical protein PN498_25240 [Oscillatoria sp. CS-180]|uniref:pyroglutamyl-peptidase I family protein n=1 Tax=Oscillatoria sp. CS-180 TaxID=3021720 RepID=UPI00232CFC4E|nr:hypothetical protein [Oscillatoria sp. CS-180]MDB9529322.1 hypothetical protein [Oscillatoria sp. CS-180]
MLNSTLKMRDVKVLVTGFKPNDDGLNASELVVNSLQNHLPELLRPYKDCLYFRVLPGNTHILGQAIAEMLTEIAPDVCIGIGQARGYNRIALERMAKNLRYFVTLDSAGNAPKGEPVVTGAPTAYWSSLPEQEELVSLLNNHTIPARLSNDCGTHLCNQAFYHYLRWQATQQPTLKAGFVHIPALPEQVIQAWSESPFMPISMTCHALALIIDRQMT